MQLLDSPATSNTLTFVTKCTSSNAAEIVQLSLSISSKSFPRATIFSVNRLQLSGSISPNYVPVYLCHSSFSLYIVCKVDCNI